MARLNQPWSIWMFAILVGICLQNVQGYFGLTGKGQLRDVDNIDHEALFIAGENGDEMYVWNENGYYTAPSKGYEKIDMSPKPDKDFPKHRGERTKKNAGWRKTDVDIKMNDDETISSAAEAPTNRDENRSSTAENQRLQPPKITLHKPGYIPVQNPNINSQIPRPYPQYRRYQDFRRFNSRRYNARPYYYYGQPMSRYGRDSTRMSTYASGAVVGNPRRPRIYIRPPPRQAVSKPVESITIPGLAQKDKQGTGSLGGISQYSSRLYNSLGQAGGPLLNPEYRRRLLAYYRRYNNLRQQRLNGKKPYLDVSKSPPVKNPTGSPVNTESLNPIKRPGRHLNGKYVPSAHHLPSLMTRRKNPNVKAQENEENVSPTSMLLKSEGQIPQQLNQQQLSADSQNSSSIHQDISSLMNLLGNEMDEKDFINVEDHLHPSSFSSSESEVGSRVTDMPEMVPSGKINKKEARKKCDDIKLTRKQRKFCRRDPGMPQVLDEATKMSVAECQYQFRFERWNCSTGATRIRLLTKETRETAFLYAISSAGLTHSVARACADGHLERCSCEETYSDNVNQEAWRWGGCGDNVRFAAKFVRQFLKSRSNGKDIRAEVNKHNSDMGIRVVKQSVQQTCKCHGVSGSCSTKTCWRKVAPFYDIGKKIKQAYDRASKVGSINSANGRPKLIRLRRSRRNRPAKQAKIETTSSTIASTTTLAATTRGTMESHTKSPLGIIANSNEERSESMRWRENPRNNELVYLENSPAYCKRTQYSLGTKGRICDKEKNCEKICCGRGYTTHIRIVRRSCECEVKWCCYVKCKTCTERREIYTCK